MTLALPEIIEQYLTLASRHSKADAELIAACFAEAGEVADEGEARRGREAIRQWWAGTATKFEYSVEVRSCHELGYGRFEVFTRLEGNFPGNVVDLAYRFTLSGGLISQLEIAPAEPFGPG